MESMGVPYPHAANCYEGFRTRIHAQAVSVVRAGRPAFVADEREVQARWFGGEYGRVFTGTAGERIEVIQFGHWNRSSGPDFTEAAVLVDGTLRRGSVEVDLDVRNWDGHGHGINPAFNDTVLHVFVDQPALNRVFTRTEAHANVVQLLLPQYSGLQGPARLSPRGVSGPLFGAAGPDGIGGGESLLVAAAQFRLKRKAERLRVMAGATGDEQAFFQAAAEALGFRWNKTAMAILAQRCPLRELLGMDRTGREARLFGAAGFLLPESARLARRQPRIEGVSASALGPVVADARGCRNDPAPRPRLENGRGPSREPPPASCRSPRRIARSLGAPPRDFHRTGPAPRTTCE